VVPAAALLITDDPLHVSLKWLVPGLSSEPQVNSPMLSPRIKIFDAAAPVARVESRNLDAIFFLTVFN